MALDKKIFSTHHGQAFGSPIISIAQNKKLASHIAKPTRIFEKDVLNCAGFNKTLTDNRVPIKPNVETKVKTIPSM